MAKKKGKFLQWVKNFAPNALDLVGDVTGVGALNRLSDVIQKQNPDNLTPEQQAEAKQFYLQELELLNQDRESARKRQVELAKTGKSDFMMYATGIVGLSSFAIVVYVALFVEIKNENLFYFIAGNVMGIASTIFAFYFGSSKKDQEKS